MINIIEDMEKHALGRDSVVVALGGGTVGDIGGFAAAIFKRGVPVIQIPTTTVAQADSAIGGKTGVDSSMSKNAFGSFYQPAAVYVDPDVLRTLDERQYLAGLVESIKHALIADRAYFEYLQKNLDKLIARDAEALEHIGGENAKIKSAVVEQDPTEKNKRRILNYGHTIGHAVESASGYQLLHGEAVAIGIIAAVMIEIEIGLAKSSRLDTIKSILEKLSQPIKIPKNIKIDTLMDLIARDKKAVNKWPKFVLLEEIGKALCRNDQWAHDIDKQTVRRIINKLYC